MDTQLETSTPAFVYHRIPTKVSRKDFNRYIDPHLKRPKTGPKPKLSLYKIFNSIFEVSHWFDQCDLQSFERSGSRVLLSGLMSPKGGLDVDYLSKPVAFPLGLQVSRRVRT